MRTQLLACLLLACTASGAQAAICRAAPTASGAANGTTWADAMTLQAALGNNGCDEIWLKQGLYKPGTQRDHAFAINRPMQIYGGFVGGETAHGQRGTDSRLTVLSGDINGNDTADVNGIVLDANDQSGDGNSYNVVYLRPNPGHPSLTRANTVIDGLTITAGRANGGSAWSGGGGLRCNATDGECSPTLRNITFSGNYASSGGAIYNSGNNGVTSPLITHSTFTGNVSVGSGGAIYNSVDSTGSGSPNIEQSTFSGNRAGQRGGAIFNIGSLQPDIAFSTFHGNTANIQAGAIASTNNAQPTITASVFSLNTATGAAKQILDESSGTRNFDGNLVQGGGCSVGVLVPNGTCTGNPLTGDPMLGTLQDNGGPTWTMLPGVGSPALGAATCTTDDTDQRGVARPTGACAMGTVEPQATVPDTPTSLSASTNQARQITLTWIASDRAVNYEVREGATTVCRTSATTCVVVGLNNDAAHNYTVAAINDAGSSSPSAAQQGSTLALPGTPASFTATPGASSVTLAWAAASDAASYVVTDTTGGGSAVVCNTASLGCTVNGLPNGTTRSFRLVARNAAGDSTPVDAGATPVQHSFTGMGPQGSVTASFTGGGNTCTFDAVQLLPAPTAGPGVPAFAHGLLDFELAHCDASDVTMTVTYPAPLPAGTRYWKQLGTAWQGYPAAIASTATEATATFILRDGGPGDDGPAGDGRIVDPGGAGLLVAAGAAAIPTLSQWGGLLLSALLGLVALRRRA